MIKLAAVNRIGRPEAFPALFDQEGFEKNLWYDPD